MKNLTRSILLCYCVMVNFSSFAQSILWQHSYGGADDDYLRAVQKTRKGYYLCGFTSSSNGYITTYHGNADAWLVKTDTSGAMLWNICYGDVSADVAYAMDTTTDGGCIIGGYTYLPSNQYPYTSTYHGNNDYWLLKVDGNGTVMWSKTYGGSDLDILTDVHQTFDGGYILAGWSISNDFDKTVSYGSADWWIIKVDDTGAIEWQKTLGGSSSEIPYSIQQTVDSGYIVAGFTASNDYDVSGLHGVTDTWVVKLDVNGNKQWTKALGGSGGEESSSVVQTFDKGYIVASASNSSDGDVSSNKGSNDYWIAKLDSSGMLQWEKSFGGSYSDHPFSIAQTSDSGYVVTGRTLSSNGDVSHNHNIYTDDAWVIKIGKTGTLQWEKSYGGQGNDWGYRIFLMSDSVYILGVASASADGDITNPQGGYDYWLAKIGPGTTGINEVPTTYTSKVYPTITSGIVTVELPKNTGSPSITIMGADGKNVGYKVLSRVDGKITLSISSVMQGTYFITVTDKVKTEVHKIVIR